MLRLSSCSDVQELRVQWTRDLHELQMKAFVDINSWYLLDTIVHYSLMGQSHSPSHVWPARLSTLLFS